MIFLLKFLFTIGIIAQLVAVSFFDFELYKIQTIILILILLYFMIEELIFETIILHRRLHERTGTKCPGLKEDNE